MGNTCCTEETKTENRSNTKPGLGKHTIETDLKHVTGAQHIQPVHGPTAYRIPGHQSRISPSVFTSISSADKDMMLVEAMKLLLSTVELSQIDSTNPTLNGLIRKTKGIATNSVGDVYEGEFVDGVPNGQGSIKYADGTVYEGGMFNGREHGVGKLRTGGALAYVFEGEFKQGRPVGIVISKPVNKAQNDCISYYWLLQC